MKHEIIEDWVETNTRQCKKTCCCGFETRWRQNEKEAMNEFNSHVIDEATIIRDPVNNWAIRND